MSAPFRQWLATPVRASQPSPAITVPELPILVVGAGPAGLAALAALKHAGIDAQGVEAHTRIGGIWDASNPLSSVYDGMHTVTSKWTTHLEHPMPRDWPPFVPHRKVQDYLARFAEREGIAENIRLGTRFVTAVKSDDGAWRAALQSGTAPLDERMYRAIVIATGSHNKNHRAIPAPLWNEAVAGGVDVLHSADYESAERFAGKRVLVVGVGNSGTDIADKVSTVARETLLSVRTPPWINPSTILGVPCDKMALDSAWLPHWYQMASFHVIRRCAIGPLKRLGLTTPPHGLIDCVPVTDRGIVRAILDGRVQIRSNVTSLADGRAHFAAAMEGEAKIDAVIFATGFARQYPLLPPLDPEGTAIRDLLPFFVFHRDEPGLAYMTEMVGTWSCWPVFVEQARTLAAYFRAEGCQPANAARFNARRSVQTPSFKGKLFSGANGYHIDYAIYTRALRDLAAWLAE
ncbi:MAG: FAD-dependent oxidoreductase [Planctomycetaceae bacterium]|nr:FAD-dependent oxidoreductase [Planctomycetaceae bacterium]